VWCRRRASTEGASRAVRGRRGRGAAPSTASLGRRTRAAGPQRILPGVRRGPAARPGRDTSRPVRHQDCAAPGLSRPSDRVHRPAIARRLPVVSPDRPPGESPVNRRTGSLHGCRQMQGDRREWRGPPGRRVDRNGAVDRNGGMRWVRGPGRRHWVRVRRRDRPAAEPAASPPRWSDPTRRLPRSRSAGLGRDDDPGHGVHSGIVRVPVLTEPVAASIDRLCQCLTAFARLRGVTRATQIGRNARGNNTMT
jgi:hypothetical protein